MERDIKKEEMKKFEICVIFYRIPRDYALAFLLLPQQNVWPSINIYSPAICSEISTQARLGKVACIAVQFQGWTGNGQATWWVETNPCKWTFFLIA